MIGGWGQAVPLVEEERASGSKDRVKEMPYWVSVSRRTGFRRLHKKSSRCGVMHWSVNSYEELDHVLKQELEQAENEDSSTSGSALRGSGRYQSGRQDSSWKRSWNRSGGKRRSPGGPWHQWSQHGNRPQTPRRRSGA